MWNGRPGASVAASTLIGAVGGDRVAVGVAGQELDVAERHVGLARSQGAQACQGDDALGRGLEGHVLFLVAEGQVRAVRDLGTALPGSLRDGCLPVGERGAGGGVAGILVEGEDAVLARELVVSECRVVCRTGGQAQAADLGAGGWVLDGEGVGVGVQASLPLGGPEGLGCVRSRAVIVGEGCNGAVGGAFSDLFLGCSPQDGRVIGGFGSGDGRRGCQPEHGGREYRGSKGCDDGSIPHEFNSFVSMGVVAGIGR